MYRFAPEYFFEAFGPILGCLKMTAIITLCSFALAFVLAIILALLAMMKNRVVQVILKFWLSLFRGTPLIAQLFLFVYGVFPLLPGGSSMSPRLSFVWPSAILPLWPRPSVAPFNPWTRGRWRPASPAA